MIALHKIATISDKLKTFIQSGNYEPYILELMNKSQIVFPGQYASNKDQSCSQCDFFDINSAEKFEAKLPFDKKEGQLICCNNANLAKWIEFMMEEELEFGEQIIQKRNQSYASNLKLYQTMAKRLKTVQHDENAIFLFPYPIALDLDRNGEFNFIHLAGDILSFIFNELQRNNLVGNRKVYAIYPAADKKMVIRCLNNNVREYIYSENLNDIFLYEFQIAR